MFSADSSIFSIRCLHLQLGDQIGRIKKVIRLVLMKLATANTKLDSIIAKVEKKGMAATKLVDDLKELRELALQEKDPLVTKVLRLSYEYLLEHKAFGVQAQYEEDEEENEYPIEIEDKENFLYLLNLLKRSDHKINREEIKDFRTALKLDLY